MIKVAWSNPTPPERHRHKPWLKKAEDAGDGRMKAAFTCSECGKQGVVEFDKGTHQHLHEVWEGIVWAEGEPDAPDAA